MTARTHRGAQAAWVRLGNGREGRDLAAHPAMMPMMMSTVMRRQHISFRLLFWCLCSSPATVTGIHDCSFGNVQVLCMVHKGMVHEIPTRSPLQQELGVQKIT